MDLKDMLGELIKVQRKALRKSQALQAEVKLNVQFNDDMREDIEHILGILIP